MRELFEAIVTKLSDKQARLAIWAIDDFNLSQFKYQIIGSNSPFKDSNSKLAGSGILINIDPTKVSSLTDTKDRIPGQLISAKTVKTSGRGAILTTTEGEIELANYRAFVTDRVNKTVDRLNGFIKDSQQTKISIEQEDRWANSLWSINFLIGGMAIAACALAIPLRMSCRFDRDRKEAIVDKKYLLYGDRQIQIPLATIDRSLIATLPFHINNRSVYSIHLIPKVGKKVPSQNLPQYQEIINVINNLIRDR